jgi:hypothetical protein
VLGVASGRQLAPSCFWYAVSVEARLFLLLCCVMSCPAAAVLPPLECQPGKGIQQAVTPDINPLWLAVKAFQAGEAGALPLSTEWSAQEQSTCTPACKYGTCVKVRLCFLLTCGFSWTVLQQQFCRPRFE